MRDLEAARAAGARPVLVRTGNGAKCEQLLPAQIGTELRVFDDLAQAAKALIEDAQRV